MRVSLDQYKDLLITYLGPLRWRTALLGVFLAVGIALQLAGPQVLQRFIDRALAGDPIRTLLVLASLYLAFAFVTQLVNLGEVWVAENIGLLATNALRSDLALHVLRLDASFHHTHPPGNLIERVDGDVAKLGNFFSRFIIQVFGNMLLGIGVLIMVFRVDWRAGIAVGIFAMAAIAVMNSLRDIATPWWAAEREASADLYGYIEERLSGTEDIRAAGATAYVMHGNHLRARTLLHTRLHASVLGSFSFSTSSVIFAVGTATALAIGIWLYNRGEVTVGTVFLLAQYTNLLSQPIEQLSRQMQDLQQAGASIGRIRDLLSQRASIVDGPGVSASLDANAPAIAFDHVGFGYSSNAAVIEDIDFSLAPGQVLGLIGHTGSGKTTITRLLARLHDPTTGTIQIAGNDLRAYRLEDVRRRVGLVTQDILLFRASVRDNLTFFDDSIPDEQIAAVINDVGLGRWLASLQDGVHTMIDSGGTGLSAGEAQLLAFARVFLGNPDIVILDEASSRLDPVTERRMEYAIDRLLTDRTAIVIAHRLATVERADLIMVLDQGRVIEFGPRVPLMQDPDSRFTRMLRASDDLFGSDDPDQTNTEASS